MTACPKCGLVESTWAAQEKEEGGWEHGCPECMFIRIRELEAELASLRFRHAEEFSTNVETFNAMQARAEKAEARVAELGAKVKREHDRAEYNAWAAAKNASAKIERVGRVAREREAE